MSKLEIGAAAPGFNLRDQHERAVKLTDFRGRKLLVYFYPRANTPGCTRQSCAVGEALPRLGDLGIDAVGISPDSPARQRKFDEQYELGFPLLADEDHAVAAAFGAWGPKTVRGQKKEGMIRSSFLIDERGKILGAWYKVKPEDTVPKALAALEE